MGQTSLRVKTYEGQKNQQELNSNLDLIDEAREEAMKQMARYYDKNVKVRRFNTRDLVLKKVS